MTADLIGVLVADNDALARRVVSSEIGRSHRFEVVGEASDWETTVTVARRREVAIVVLELRVGGEGSSELIRQVLDGDDPPYVVVFSAGTDVDAAVDAIAAGAAGFVTKDDGAAALLPALDRVSAGEVVLPGMLAMKVIELVRDAPEGGVGMRPVVSQFTAREWEILDVMSTGASTQEIADELVLSAHTIYSHIKNIMHKLDVHTRAEAVAKAQELRAAPRDGGALAGRWA